MGFMKNVNKNNLAGFSSTPLKSNFENKQSNAIPKRISKADINTLFISIPFLLVNVIIDISLGIYYAHIGATYFSVATFAFLFFSQIIIQLFSVIWYFNDGCHFHVRKIFVHAFLLQPVERYTVLFKKARVAMRQRSYGVNPSREEYVTRFYEHHTDVNILRLFSVYLGTVPQFCLQTYVIVGGAGGARCVFTYISCVCAMLTLGWVQINYTHAMRHVYNKPDHIDNQLLPHLVHYVILSLAHISFVIARGLCVALFASAYPNYIIPILVFHGLIMILWVVIQKPDFASNAYEHGLYIFVVSVIYMFTFFNVKEGNTRYRAIAYYGLSALENLAMMSSWKYYVVNGSYLGEHTTNAIPITVMILYLLGLIFIFIYYTFFHPNGFATQSSSGGSTAYSETESSISGVNAHTTQWKPNDYNRPNNAITDNNRKDNNRMFRSSGLQTEPIRFTKVDDQSISPIGFRSCVTDPSVYHDAVDGSYDAEGFKHYSIDAGKADSPLENMPSPRHNLGDLFSDAATARSSDVDSQLNRNVKDISPDSADMEVCNTMVVRTRKYSPHKKSRIAGPFRRCKTYNYDVSNYPPSPQVKFKPQQPAYRVPRVISVDANTQYTPKSSHPRRKHHHHHHRKYTRCKNCGAKSEHRKPPPIIVVENCEDTFVTVNDGLSVDATLYSSAVDDAANHTIEQDDPTPMIW